MTLVWRAEFLSGLPASPRLKHLYLMVVAAPLEWH
jgi:hypothetical protein